MMTATGVGPPKTPGVAPGGPVEPVTLSKPGEGEIGRVAGGVNRRNGKVDATHAASGAE